MKYQTLLKYINNNNLKALERMIRNMDNLKKSLHKHTLFGECDMMRLAISYGTTEFVKLLLDNGTPLNPEEEYSPLEYACLGNRWEMIEYLLSQGGQVTGKRGLAFLAAMGKIHFIKNMVELGVDINTPDDGGRNALRWAIQEDQSETVDYLIDAGCNVHAESHDGETLLYVAAAENALSTARRLIDWGVKIDKNKDYLPFQIAQYLGNYEMCDLLLDAGADVNFQDTDGRTALFYAKLREDKKGIQYLMGKGADDTIVDNKGIGIKDLANETIRKPLHKYLYD